MQQNKPKYSIIIPVKNAVNYLPECINSVTRQNYSDYEIIISDDRSVDGTKEYLNTINHPNIKIIHHLNEAATAVENFNFAIEHAIGQWLMYLGGDDGLQPYFFNLADMLTDVAMKKGIRAIASRRAYYFWDGCQPVYGDTAVSYSANFKKKSTIKKTSIEIIKTLLGFRDCGYFSLPQMYTTSLFHSSLIEDAKKLKDGKFITFSWPDVDLAAISTSMEKYFIDSEIPLGWVGSSPATTFRDENLVKGMAKRVPASCGNYHLNSISVWFWGALLDIPQMQKNKTIGLISSKCFMVLMFGQVLFSLNRQKEKEIKKEMLVDIVRTNNISVSLVLFISKIWLFCNIIFRINNKITRVPFKILNYYKKKYLLSKTISRTDCPEITLSQASDIIIQLTHGLF